MGAFTQAGKSTGSTQGGSAPRGKVSRRNWSWGSMFPPTVLANQESNANQWEAHVRYQSLWDADPLKFVNTMAADLKTGKITQEYFDWQYTDKDRMKLRNQVESQAAAKAKQEKALAQQREVAKQAELAAQRLAQQQRTLQNLDAEQEGTSATVVSGGGNATIGSSGGRRRRGSRLSAVLGI